MIKSFFSAVLLLIMLSVSSMADAHTARQVTIDPIPTLSYSTFPQTYEVSGFIEHNPVDVLQNLTLFVNGEAVALVALPFSDVDGATTTYTLPWQITEPGTYTLQTKVRHGFTGIVSSSTTQIVEVTEFEVVVPDDEPELDEPLDESELVACDAAPAHAAQYLKTLNEKPKGKEQANIISMVARHMGPATHFDGVAACDPEYAEVVQGFVDDLRVEGVF